MLGIAKVGGFKSLIQRADLSGNGLVSDYPYGLLITPAQHVWMTDGGYDRIVELDQNGKILGILASTRA